MAPTNARLALSIPCYCAVGFVRNTSAAAHNGTRRTSSSSCSGPCTSQASTPAQGPRTVTRCITEHSCRRRVVCTAEPHQPLGEPLPTCSSHVGTAYLQGRGDSAVPHGYPQQGKCECGPGHIIRQRGRETDIIRHARPSVYGCSNNAPSWSCATARKASSLASS